MPGAEAADAVALAFQGIDQSPTLTSGSSWPASSGSDQGQQKPATSRAVRALACPARGSARSSSPIEPTIRKSNSSSIGQRTCGVRSSSSVLSTHLMNESEPFERNCACELEVADLERRAWRRTSRMRSVLPTSPGRTTCRSSMKKTDTRLASRMSSIWALPVRAFAGVKRLVLIVRMRWASSRTTTSSGSVDVRGVAEVLEQRARPAADDLAQVLGERLGAGDVEGLEAQRGQLGDEVDRDDRLPGARARPRR